MRIKTNLVVPVVAMGLGALAVTGISAASAAPKGAATTTVSAAAASACKADYSVIPADWSTEKGGYDIGHLTKVTSKDGVVKLQIDRVSFYTGAEAKALNDGVVPMDGYTEVDLSSKKRTFTLDPKASILATNETSEGGVDLRKKFTQAQFLSKAAKADLAHGEMLVWLRHTDGMSGDVTAIAEQYVP